MKRLFNKKKRRVEFLNKNHIKKKIECKNKIKAFMKNVTTNSDAQVNKLKCIFAEKKR